MILFIMPLVKMATELLLVVVIILGYLTPIEFEKDYLS